MAACARSSELGEQYVDTVLQINRLLNRATPNRRLSTYLSSLEQQTAQWESFTRSVARVLLPGGAPAPAAG